MKLFISWSGLRSRMLAEALRDWLPCVLTAVEPWLSTDAEKGTLWASKLSGALKSSAFGVICVTAENLREPWILFEAGALSKSIDRTMVCPYLLDVNPAVLPPALQQFQTARATKQETRALLKAINARLGDRKLQQGRLDKAFEKRWPDLQQRIRKLGLERSEPFSEKNLLDELLRCVEEGGDAHLWKSFAERTITNRWVRLSATYSCGESFCGPGDPPCTAPRGSRLCLEYRLRSSLDLPVQVWLGANLRGAGTVLFNLAEDTQEQMGPGDHVFIRDLTIQTEWPIGEYQLHAECWYGRRSHPNRSIALAELWERPLRVRITES